MKSVSEYIGYGVDDIITLSDIQTQKEFGKTSVDFRITGTRFYEHPGDVFKYTAYVASYQADPESEEQQIMLLIRQVGSDFDIHVYYLDNEGPSENFEELFSEEEDDLVDRFEVSLHFDDSDFPVTWDRQGQSNFGIVCIISEADEPCCKTLAEYFTNDDTRGNPHCFIEWTGDKEGGYIELWYGCEIRLEDVEIFHTNKQEGI
jgi:hypothetical protein